MLTDEGLMVVHMQQKSCSSQQLGFLASCPPGGGGSPLGGSYYQTQSHHSAPGSQRRLIEGSVKQYKKNCVTAHIALLHIQRSLLNSCKKCLLGVGRCRNWGGGVVIILLLNC